ncbi:MAG: 16S rRNA (cytidine(1402)-2'-O)-methyltransferase [Patescibacteria group bacterium]|nr:16S rRNA (cytidine(1402)-2'-O)-methyltransferase [Patescibacteria group bacterium]
MLSIVCTPIGNVTDISIRQAHALFSADIILAEDTRRAGRLLSDIAQLLDLERNEEQKLVSYYKEVEFEKIPDVLRWLTEGKRVALISDAGTPLVSDPGYLLVQQVIKRDMTFTVIPGPSSVTTALIHAGFQLKTFYFAGFLPKKNSAAIKMVKSWVEMKRLDPDMLIVFFETTHRIGETLTILESILPERRLAICRELTKTHESVVRGTPAELRGAEYRGELTIVLE